MAPTTRRSQAGGGFSKKPARRQVNRQESTTDNRADKWSFLNVQDEQQTNGAHDDHRNEGQEEEEAPPPIAIESPAGVDKAVIPLRDMAEKVGREVENFATTLDQYLQDLPTRDDEYAKYHAAQDVVREFETIAGNAVQELKKRHGKERMQQLRKEWSEQARITTASTALRTTTSSASRNLSTRAAEQVAELREWQQEVDLWQLFSIILELHYQPEDVIAQDKEEKLAKISQPHRYTPEADVWDRFLAEDGLAKKRSLIKRWLEQTAEHQESDLHGIVEELEARAGAGKGLWTRGWMSTREKIKGEKRLRSWPSGSDSVQPQIRSSDTNVLLVTTLDPDAPTRQQRALQKQDAYFERATWVVCWEMLRRGKSWEEVKAWCEERNEGWRAAAIGKAGDASDALSNVSWRKMCSLASQAPASNEYEAAVFGLLGGNVSAAQKMCRNVDDHLFVYYSTMLVRQFDHYLLQHCPDKVPANLRRTTSTDNAVQDAARAEQAVTDLIKSLRGDRANTRAESVRPMKILQSYMLADEIGSLITTVGTAVSDLDEMSGRAEGMILRLRPRAKGEKLMVESEVALNPRTLRITAHLAIVLRGLRKEPLEEDEQDAEENVLVSYVQALRAAGKRDLIPLYASKLQRARYIVTLARVLADVTQPSEQEELLNLLRTYDMDTLSICQEQLTWSLEAALRAAHEPDKPLAILERTEENRIHPSTRIKVEFLREELDEKDVGVVRSLQWFQLIRGEWKVTFQALALAVRQCLVHGRFACALEIVRNLPYESISTLKAYHAMGRSINMMDTSLPPPEDEDKVLRCEIMRRQSRTYYELELLVRAVEALAQWAVEERKYTTQLPRPAGGPPAALKQAKFELDDAMAPLLSGILLNPVDEEEAEDLITIRVKYLPEIVLAYNTALYTAGPTITRDSLLESMDLSIAVALESNGLADAFQQAGRVRELVQSFAQTSKLMLIMKAEGKPWKPRKDRVGKDLGMWEIGPQGQAGAVTAGDSHHHDRQA